MIARAYKLLDVQEDHEDSLLLLAHPTKQQISALRLTDLVKLLLVARREGHGLPSESIWVRVKKWDGKLIQGRIWNNRRLQYTSYHGVYGDDYITFELRHIMAIDSAPRD